MFQAVENQIGHNRMGKWSAYIQHQLCQEHKPLTIVNNVQLISSEPNLHGKEARSY